MPKSKALPFPDIHFAVFNMHVNDAGKRAMAVVRQLGPDSESLGRMESDYKNGVMAMFDREPDQASRAFGILCFTFANGLDK